MRRRDQPTSVLEAIENKEIWKAILGNFGERGGEKKKMWEPL